MLSYLVEDPTYVSISSSNGQTTPSAAIFSQDKGPEDKGEQKERFLYYVARYSIHLYKPPFESVCEARKMN